MDSARRSASVQDRILQCFGSRIFGLLRSRFRRRFFPIASRIEIDAMGDAMRHGIIPVQEKIDDGHRMVFSGVER